MVAAHRGEGVPRDRPADSLALVARGQGPHGVSAAQEEVRLTEGPACADFVDSADMRGADGHDLHGTLLDEEDLPTAALQRGVEGGGEGGGGGAATHLQVVLQDDPQRPQRVV
eukprot:scaffold4342_cov166-Ochromonas_danica.AAC.16